MHTWDEQITRKKWLKRLPIASLSPQALESLTAVGVARQFFTSITLSSPLSSGYATQIQYQLKLRMSVVNFSSPPDLVLPPPFWSFQLESMLSPVKFPTLKKSDAVENSGIMQGPATPPCPPKSAVQKHPTQNLPRESTSLADGYAGSSFLGDWVLPWRSRVTKLWKVPIMVIEILQNN